MGKPTVKLIYLIIFLVIFSFYGCAGGPWGRLELVEDPTEDGLRQNWNESTFLDAIYVYVRRIEGLRTWGGGD
jgi:hypothetical protein